LIIIFIIQDAIGASISGFPRSSIGKEYGGWLTNGPTASIYDWVQSFPFIIQGHRLSSTKPFFKIFSKLPL
jgi:hypothetical protein